MTSTKSSAGTPRESRALLWGWTVSLCSATSTCPALLLTHAANVFWVSALPGALGNENILGIKGDDDPILPPRRILSSGDTNKKQKPPSIQTELRNCR